MRQFITALLSDKPYIGVLAGMTSLLSAILAWLQVITVVFGFLGAVFGAAAGFYTFLIKRKEWKNGKK